MMTRNKEKGDGFFNWALWTNPEFDAIANELRGTFDEARRNELYRAGLALAQERVNAVYLYQNQIVWRGATAWRAPCAPMRCSIWRTSRSGRTARRRRPAEDLP